MLAPINLTAASIAFAAGAGTIGLALGSLVAGLALLAATTGLCAGCTAYRIGYAVTGRPFVSCPLPRTGEALPRG